MSSSNGIRRLHQHIAVVPGVTVLASGAHRYKWREAMAPAEVELKLRTYDATPEFSVSTYLTPALARRLATALVEAADIAERAAPTDDNLPEEAPQPAAEAAP